MHLIPTGNFLRDLGEVEKRIATQVRDRQTAERFGAEVATMMKRRSLAQPVQMAAACIGQRARDLVMRNMAGWARMPASPQKFILVDPRGCVLTDLDGKEIPPPIGVSLPPFITRSPATIISAYRPEVTSAEGAVPHIYLDSNGKPTVGIGHLITSEADAKDIHARFGFYTRDANGRTTSIKATDADVLADLRNVTTHKLGNVAASNYRQFTTVDMTPQGIQALRDRNIEIHLDDILKNRGRFLNYLTYPSPAQLALLDLVFNRGLGKVIAMSSLMEFVRNRNWVGASKSLAGITEPSVARISAVRKLFDDAARQEPFFIDPKCPYSKLGCKLCGNGSTQPPIDIPIGCESAVSPHSDPARRSSSVTIDCSPQNHTCACIARRP